MITRNNPIVLEKKEGAIEAFKEGVKSVFNQWTALELAVHHGWGGVNSSEKSQGLIQEVIDLFDGKEKIYKDVYKLFFY